MAGETTLRFGVILEDSVSGASARASSSLDKLSTSLGGVSKETERLGKMQAQALAMNARFDAQQDTAVQRMGRMQAEALRMNEAFDKAKNAPPRLATEMQRVIEPTEVLRHSFEEAGRGVREFATSLASGDIKGAVTGLADALAGLSQTLDLVVPGLGQVASAAIKAGGAFAAMTVGVVESAVHMALEVTATNERLEATFQALGRGPDAGRRTLEMLDSLSGKLPQSRAQLAEWTKQYEAMGVTDLGALRRQVLATASAQAIAGDAGAMAYTTLERKVRGAIDSHEGLIKVDRRMINTLHELGAGDMLVGGRKLLQDATVDARAFGDALQASLAGKGKGPLAAMLTELGTLGTKGREILGHLFDGIDTKPLTQAFYSVIHLGDLGKPSGKALAGGIKGGLNEIVYTLGKTVTQAEVIFLTMELYAIKWGVTSSRVVTGLKLATSLAIGAVVVLGTASAVAFAPMILTVGALTAGIWAAYRAYLVLKYAISGGPGDNVAAGPMRLATNAAGQKMESAGVRSGDISGHTTALRLPGHAEGGLVLPARGELIASVAPGERILPAGASGGGGSTIHVDRLTVTVQAPQGVTDAQALSVVGLSVALERLQLAAGR